VTRTVSETCVLSCSCCCRCWQGRVQSSPTASSLTSCPCQWWSTPSSTQPAVGHPSSLTLVGILLQHWGWLCRGWLCSSSYHMPQACQGCSCCITSAGALHEYSLLSSDVEHQHLHVFICDDTAGGVGCRVSMPAPYTTPWQQLTWMLCAGPRCHTMKEGSRRVALDSMMDLSHVVLMTQVRASSRPCQVKCTSHVKCPLCLLLPICHHSTPAGNGFSLHHPRRVCLEHVAHVAADRPATRLCCVCAADR
jgi:hypothetical protein